MGIPWYQEAFLLYSGLFGCVVHRDIRQPIDLGSKGDRHLFLGMGIPLVYAMVRAPGYDKVWLSIQTGKDIYLSHSHIYMTGVYLYLKKVIFIICYYINNFWIVKPSY